MRLLISLLAIGQLVGCTGHPLGADESENNRHQPRPSVELSTFTFEDHVAAVYVRHSRCNVLLYLTPTDADLGIQDKEHKLVLRLAEFRHRKFNPVRYEDFDQSLDIFQDGRIVVVPLPEYDGKAVGVFVNLLSRKRYFFVPAIESDESLAKVRRLSKRSPHVKVVRPADKRAHELLPRFPEFQQ